MLSKEQFAQIEEGFKVLTNNTALTGGYVVLKKNATTVWLTPNLSDNQWNFSSSPIYKGIRKNDLTLFENGSGKEAKILDDYKNRRKVYTNS